MLILYNPPSSARKKPVLPLSLLALGAVLEGQHDYLIVDGNLESDPLEALEQVIRAHGATMLAVTVMPGPQLTDATPLCRELKARHPSLTIIWGGYFPTQHYEPCLRSGYVDYVVRGHGDPSRRDAHAPLTRRSPFGCRGAVSNDSSSDMKSLLATVTGKVK